MASITLDKRIIVEGTHALFAITESDSEALYAFNKNFWTERNEANTQADIDLILSGYRARSTEADRVVPAENIAKLAAPVIANGGTFGVLEIGCANGPLLRALQELNALPGIRYVGMEPYAPFVTDFKDYFPDHRAMIADAEDFITMSADDFPEAPFQVFYAAVTLCMMSPDIVRACLAKAAEFCDEFVLYDFVMNGLGPFNRQETVVFEFNKDTSQYYYAHNFVSYFADLGFEIVAGIPLPHPTTGADGYAVIRAVRKSLREKR